MRSLHKNENLLFKDFQDFLVRTQQLSEKRIPFYLRWVSGFHEFCSRQNVDGMGNEAIASYLQDLAKDNGDWQVQQAKEASANIGTLRGSRRQGCILNFRDSGRDHTDEDEGVGADILQLMFFPSGDRNYAAGGEGHPLALAINRPFPGMHENFVLPFMGMPAAGCLRRQLKDPHAEIPGPIGLPDDYPADGPFALAAGGANSLGLFIMDDFHTYLRRAMISSCRATIQVIYK